MAARPATCSLASYVVFGLLASADAGLTVAMHGNTALALPATKTSVIPVASANFSTADGPFSAEISGTISFPHSGLYSFDCRFASTTMAFVWVDGHLVCQDGNVYDVGAAATDNPLPVRRVTTYPLRAHVYYSPDATPVGPPAPAPHVQAMPCDESEPKQHDWHLTLDEATGFKSISLSSGLCVDATDPGSLSLQPCLKSQAQLFDYNESSGEITGPLWPSNEGGLHGCFDVSGKTGPNMQLTRCYHQPNDWFTFSEDGQWFTRGTEAPFFRRCMQFVEAAAEADNLSASGDGQVSLDIRWGIDGGAVTHIPSIALAEQLPPAEMRRDAMQRETSAGWGTMLHRNMLEFTNFPSGAALRLQVCQTSTASCVEAATGEGGQAGIRVGPYAVDRSYGQFSLLGGPGTVLTFGNLSVAFTGGTDGLRMMVAPQGCDHVNCSDLAVVVSGRFLFYRAGDTAVDQTGIDFSPLGLPAFRVAAFSDVHAVDESRLILNLGSGPAVISTFADEDAESITRTIAAAGEAHTSAIEARFGDGESAEAAVAIEAAIMWNLVTTPAENGFAAFLPISRAWSRVPHSHPDFSYSLFGWDNFFASMLSGLLSKEIAYSNLIQAFKSKTAEGYVANCAAGGYKDQDRTAPPLSGKVLLSLYERYGDKWIVELLFDDVLDWSDWFLRMRVLEPAGLIAVGSYNERSGSAGNMQTARYESGLDDSPMYDGDFFNSTTGLMELYDVGMTSLVAHESYALADLAEAIGRPEADMLRQRGDRFRDLIRSHLWNDELGIFVNRFSNGTFSDRVSPTSFYPMQAGAASDEQARAMVNDWLLSPTRFCLAPNGDFEGNDDVCYWGLPSIQASDDAFPALGYWRGLVWGPMAMLTYWSLEKYQHLPEVARAKAALSKQMRGLMLSQWRMNRHICENYGPHKDTPDCTGTKFHHWGALTGLIGLLEEGFWSSESGSASQVFV